MKRNVRRGTHMLRALRYVEGGGYTVSDLIVAMLTAPYGTSQAGFQYRARQAHRERLVSELRAEERAKAAARYYVLLSRLRKEGLVAEGASRVMRLTSRGKLKMQQLSAEIDGGLPDAKRYVPAKGAQLVILAFDVPEDQRRKRVWLREVLAHLGFTMKQQSLWIGEVKVPQEFLLDLDRLGLAQYIEIFAVTKTGSLEEVK